MSNNIIQLNETLIKDHLKNLVRNSVEETLNALLDYEANELVKADATNVPATDRVIAPDIMTGPLPQLPVM